jgi:hypothetical protein
MLGLGSSFGFVVSSAVKGRKARRAKVMSKRGGLRMAEYMGT